LDHLGSLVVPAELIQLPKPEVVTGYVVIRRIVRVSPQIAEVLHQDKRSVEFAREERLVLCHSAHHAGTRAGGRVEFIKRCLPLSGGWRDAGMLIKCIYILGGSHRFRIEIGKLFACDETLCKRLLVLLE